MSVNKINAWQRSKKNEDNIINAIKSILLKENSTSYMIVDEEKNGYVASDQLLYAG